MLPQPCYVDMGWEGKSPVLRLRDYESFRVPTSLSIFGLLVLFTLEKSMTDLHLTSYNSNFMYLAQLSDLMNLTF